MPESQGTPVAGSSERTEVMQTGKPKRKGYNQRSREEIERLKEKIQIGVLRGDPPRAVAKALNIPAGTMYRYLQELGEETRKERLAKSGVLVHSYFTRIEDTIRELDAQYNRTHDSRLLKDRADVLHAAYDRLQSAGFIPKRKDESDVNFKGELKAFFAGCVKKPPTPP